MLMGLRRNCSNVAAAAAHNQLLRMHPAYSWLSQCDLVDGILCAKDAHNKFATRCPCRPYLPSIQIPFGSLTIIHTFEPHPQILRGCFVEKRNLKKSKGFLASGVNAFLASHSFDRIFGEDWRRSPYSECSRGRRSTPLVPAPLGPEHSRWSSSRVCRWNCSTPCSGKSTTS
ncbi:hypothetical protein EXIGLDRAFT_835964, partial [Exidia glandulosa HHB12029]